MKISCDLEVDALAIVFRETTVTTKHLAEGIAADYDANGRLAGLEILDAKSRFGDESTFAKVTLDGLALAAKPSAYSEADGAHIHLVKEDPPKPA